MSDFADLIPFADRNRWLMFQACAAPDVDARKFARDMGMSERRIRDILFSEKVDVGDMNLREIAHWFYFTVGKTPEFSLVPRGRWHQVERMHDRTSAGTELLMPHSMLSELMAEGISGILDETDPDRKLAA